MSDQTPEHIIEETEEADRQDEESSAQPKEKVKKPPTSLTTPKRVKEILKRAKKPSIASRHLEVAKQISENIRKSKKERRTVEQILKDNGYADSTAKTGLRTLKGTETWPELMEIFINDADLAKHHHQLMNAVKIGSQTFSMGVKDEEIIEVINSFGFEVMKVLFVKGLGKVAYYPIPDNIAKKYALEMAHKLKQKYGDITIVHKFGELSDEEIEGEIAGEVSEAIGLVQGEGEEEESE